MRFIAALLCALTMPILATAQQLPDAFMVTGVASNDVLNIRTEPKASSAIIGTLDPYGFNIEVIKLSPNGKWGMVSAGERNGWVAMRFSKRTNATAPNEIPRPMICFGNEPFWALGMYPNGDEYQLAGESRHDLTPINEVVSYQGYAVVFQEGPTLNRTLMIQRGYCDDGMSDLEYGWRAILLNETPQGSSLNFGCCTLDNR
ncbi:MAG TPA: hypothetical protein EYP10_08845 [Armatimonadetes bacterium]|nr:hypothetical protein [Armatimonadota bacterium]